MSILDAIARPRRVVLLGIPWRVPPLTLGDLADLQAWVAAESWDPWEVPPADSEADHWAFVVAKSEHWPPPAWSKLARQATDHDAFLREFFWIAAGRHSPADRATSDRACSGLTPTEWDALFAAAYGSHPMETAGARLNALDGEGPDPGEIDWPAAIAELIAEFPALAVPGAIDRLSLPAWRLLRRKGKALAGRIQARPGESEKDAIRRRQGLVAAARDRLAEWVTPRPAGDSPTAGPAT
jgi:hypothetical protein